MFLATINKPKQLLHLSLIDQVRVEELAQSWENVATLVAELAPGFRLLTDMGRLGSLDPNGKTEIGKMMELCDEKGVALIVRVIPDPTKDIGFGILSRFHYRNNPRIITCNTMVEAAKLLSL
jgi:hypothetical protein